MSSRRRNDFSPVVTKVTGELLIAALCAAIGSLITYMIILM